MTWEPIGEKQAATIRNRIAAILPKQTSEREVIRTLYLLYANHLACSGLSDSLYVSEQLRFAKRDYPYKAQRPLFPEISCGGNPYLFARPVYNLRVEEDKEGFQVLRWEQPIYPYPPRGASVSDWSDEIQRRRPFKLRRMVFCAKNNMIAIEPEGDSVTTD